MAYLEYIPLRPMYHYTSEESFKGILETHELWLSDLQSSNDPRDLKMGLQKLTTITNQIAEQEYSRENAAVLAKLTDKMVRYFDTGRCYTTCFTPHADNINMWREYGDSGKGYSIGFKPRAITDMHGRIYKVYYVDDRNNEDIYNLISEIVKPIEIYGNQIFSDIEKELEIGTALISIVNSLKHISWEYEEEIRLTFASGNHDTNGIPVSISPNNIVKPWKKSQVRQAGGNSVRYHALPFGKFVADKNDPRESIFEVVVGPNSQMTESETKRILLDNGFSNFAIRKSGCAFK